MHPESRNTLPSPRRPVECSFRLDCFGFSCAKLEMAERWMGRENHLSMSGNVLHAREKLCVLTRGPPPRRGVCGKLPETCDFVSQVILKIMHTHKCVCFLQNRKLWESILSIHNSGENRKNTASLLRRGCEGIVRKLLLCSTSKEFNGVIKMKGDKDNCLKLIGLCFW